MFDWQSAIALFAVALAIAYLGRCAWRTLFAPAKAGCGRCGSCPQESAQSAVVTIDSLLQKGSTASDKTQPAGN